MGEIESAWLSSPSRRKALAQMATFVAASAPASSALAHPDPIEPLSQVSRISGLAEMRTAYDFFPLFEGNLPATLTEYTAHGDGTEFNIKRNLEGFDWIDILRSDTPVPTSQIDLSSELFGVRMKFPILVAPSSGQDSLHPEGQIGMFKGANAASKTIDILASGTQASVEAALKAVPDGTMWSQFYPIENPSNMERILNGVQAAGANCIVVTCDQQAPIYQRDLLLRNLGGRVKPIGSSIGFGDFEGGAGARIPSPGPAAVGSTRYRVSDRRLWYTWDYIDVVRKVAKGKLLVKGIIAPDDARLAIEHGADGIIVSNHGGRAMDYGPSTIEILPEIVAVVKGRIPILIDSGFRRGSDVFKALALGANAICLGKAARWGLGAFGAVGAQRVFEIVQNELLQTAAAAGCSKLSDINASKVRTNFV